MNRITVLSDDGATMLVRYILEPAVVEEPEYGAAAVERYLLQYRDWLSVGKFAPSVRQVSEQARGKIAFESKPPASAFAVRCDLDRAMRSLPTRRQRQIVVAFVMERNRHGVRRRVGGAYKDCCEELDAAIGWMARFLQGNDDR